MKFCDYTRTASGRCQQPAMKGSDVCFYHDKVRRNLISADERESLVSLPSIRSDK